jgi:hypothetical protein
MRRACIFAGLLLLGGCDNPFTLKNTAYNMTSADTLKGECERAAYDDPEVKDVLAKTAGSVGYDPMNWMDRLQRAKREAVQRCMYQRGGPAQRGGVELPRQ